MNITFLLSFFFAHGAHSSAPLFEMRERSELAKPTTTTKIFESGAWTVESDGHVESGRFDREELGEIRDAVQHAAWKVTTSPIKCFAYDPNFTEYFVHGKLRFTERMCSGKTADFATLQAIDLVKQDLAQDAKPLFEIRRRSDIAAPTWTIDIFASGRWTYQPIDKNGVAGTIKSGHFDKDTTESVTDVIKQSPWDTTLLRLVCRAYSPSFTEYYVNGTLEYTARMCGAQRLDAKSLGAIDVINDDLARVLPKRAALAVE